MEQTQPKQNKTTYEKFKSLLIVGAVVGFVAVYAYFNATFNAIIVSENIGNGLVCPTTNGICDQCLSSQADSFYCCKLLSYDENSTQPRTAQCNLLQQVWSNDLNGTRTIYYRVLVEKATVGAKP